MEGKDSGFYKVDSGTASQQTRQIPQQGKAFGSQPSDSSVSCIRWRKRCGRLKAEASPLDHQKGCIWVGIAAAIRPQRRRSNRAVRLSSSVGHILFRVAADLFSWKCEACGGQQIVTTSANRFSESGLFPESWQGRKHKPLFQLQHFRASSSWRKSPTLSRDPGSCMTMHLLVAESQSFS